MKNNTKKSLGLRLAGYLFSLLALVNPVMPAIADILYTDTIERDFNENPFYMPAESSDYQFKAPQFVEWPSAGTRSLESVYEQLLNEQPSTIGDPTYVPIINAGITIIIPVYEKYKYIGTPAVQSRYVRSQMVALLGRNLAGYSTEASQLNDLYAKAIAYAKSTGTRYGAQLLMDQADAEEDMIWPELRTINGQDVIVPVVYLKASTVSQYKVVSNQQELPSSAQFANLTIKNSDVKVDRDAFINVANNLRLSGGSLTNDEGSLKIVAGGAFDNASSVVSANGDLVIGAKNIHNHTIVYRYDLGHQQGTFYGEISNISSTNGNVVLRAYENIQFNGADATALNGAITLAADGNILIGTQQLYSAVDRGRSYSRSEVSYLQSHLTAEDTISLMANGQIILQAAEIASDKGHIELLAGMGVSVLDELGSVQSQSHYKFGKTTVDKSSYRTIAMRSVLDAGRGIKIHSTFGDITLRAADISSIEGTSVRAENGTLNMLMTVENDHFNYSSVKKSLFTIKTESRGHNRDTAVPNTIIGGFEAEALYGVNVQYEGDPSLNHEEQVAVLAQAPELKWMENIRSQYPEADWEAVDTVYDEWRESNTSLSPAAMAVIMIAVACATGGAGATLIGATGPVTSAVANAALTSIVSTATVASANSLVNGGSILDATRAGFEAAVSEEGIKSAATAMVTAGIIASIDANFFTNSPTDADVQAFAADNNLGEVVKGSEKYKDILSELKDLTFGQQAIQALTHATVRAGIQTAVNDDAEFSDVFRQSLMQSATDAIGKYTAEKIGDAFDGPDATGVQTALKYASHAAVGCILGAANASVTDGVDAESNCYAQGGGAVVGEFIGSISRESQEIQEAQEDLNNYLESKVERIDELLDSGLSEKQVREVITAESNQLIRDVQTLAQRGVDLAKFSGALAALVAGADAAGVNAAATGAQNAAKYNAFSDVFAKILEATEIVKDLLSQPIGPLEALTTKLADHIIKIGVDLESADVERMAGALEGALGLVNIDINSLVAAGIDITNPSVVAGLLASVIDTVGVAAIAGDVALRTSLSPFLGGDLNNATIERAGQAVNDTVDLVRNLDEIIPAMGQLIEQATVDGDPYSKAQVARLVGGIAIGIAVGKLAIAATPATFGASLLATGPAALRIQKALALLKKLAAEGKVKLQPLLDKLPFGVKFRQNANGDGYEAELETKDIDNAEELDDSLSLVSSRSVPPLSDQEINALEATGMSRAEIDNYMETLGDLQLFRGTSAGFRGSDGTVRSGYTPTSIDPLVSIIFGLQSKGNGAKAILLFGSRTDFDAEMDIGNYRAELERELAFPGSPDNFAELAPYAIDIDDARAILRDIDPSFDLPSVVNGNDHADSLLRSTPRMTNEQIKEFISRVTEQAGKEY